MAIQSRPLTPLQVSFCDNYIRNGFNAKQAALDAGYSEPYARQASLIIKNNPVISDTIDKAIKTAQRDILKQCGATYEARVRKLWKVVEHTIPEDNDPIHPYVKNAIAAIAEINKMSGDYAPDKKLSLTVDMTKDKMQEVKKAYEEY